MSEEKRLEAAVLRGVSYDARSDKFTAEIYVDGVRNWLGSFGTAQEASQAYLGARKARGPIRRSLTSFAQLYTAFRERHGGDHEEPPLGAALEYDGQRFTYAGDAWRKGQAGRTFRYGLWDSQCCACGEEYQTMVPFSPSIAKGVTRNCPDHTRGRRLKAKNERLSQAVEDQDEDWVTAALAGADPEPSPAVEENIHDKVCRSTLEHLEVLAMTSDRQPVGEVSAYLCRKLYRFDPESSEPGMAKRLSRWAGGEFNVPCPFTLEDGVVAFV